MSIIDQAGQGGGGVLSPAGTPSETFGQPLEISRWFHSNTLRDADSRAGKYLSLFHNPAQITTRSSLS